MVIQRQRLEATKFIDNLKIHETPAYTGVNGLWFKKVNMPLNPELTAIIGNKGSGKSALADILGLLGDARTEDSFSFLANSHGNVKFRQKGYAENFDATLTWADTNQSSNNLNDGIDRAEPERVKYLPQNYFETLTNEIKEARQFQTEIENVVFSHVEESDRLNQSSFKELAELKTQDSRKRISDLKKNLTEIHHRLLDMKSKSKEDYKYSLKKDLEKLHSELKALKASIPDEVLKPSAESQEQQQHSKRIDRLNTHLVDLDARRSQLNGRLTDAKERREKLRGLETSLLDLKVHIKSQREHIEKVCAALGLTTNAVFQADFDLTSLIALKDTIESEIASLTRDNALQPTTESNIGPATNYNSIPDTPCVRLVVHPLNILYRGC